MIIIIEPEFKIGRSITLEHLDFPYMFAQYSDQALQLNSMFISEKPALTNFEPQ